MTLEDESLWQLSPSPRQTIGEWSATLPESLRPPVLHLRRVRWLLPDGDWIPVLVPVEYFPEWMDPDWRPQLALEAAA